MQDECTHPIWLWLNEDTDEHEGRTYYDCECVACGKIEERRDRDFGNKVVFARRNKDFGDKISFSTRNNKINERYKELKR